MDNVLDKNLYLEVKKDIITKYPKHSAFRSMMIQKAYKDRGGKYKNTKKKDLIKWINEKWVNVDQYLNNNTIVKCGDKNFINKSACRPLIKIDKKTPITINELLEKYDKKDIIKAVNKKNKDPQNSTLFWNKLKVIKRN